MRSCHRGTPCGRATPCTSPRQEGAELHSKFVRQHHIHNGQRQVDEAAAAPPARVSTTGLPQVRVPDQ